MNYFRSPLLHFRYCRIDDIAAVLNNLVFIRRNLFQQRIKEARQKLLSKLRGINIPLKASTVTSESQRDEDGFSNIRIGSWKWNRIKDKFSHNAKLERIHSVQR